MTTTAWPFGTDANENDPLTALRMTMASPPAPDPPLSEPDPAPGWWEETPAEAARYDRYWYDRDED